MSREFRIAVNITLPSDEMEETEAKLQAFKVKGAIQKLVGEYKLTATVEHETVTPRTSTPKPAIPAAPPSQSAPVIGDPSPVTGLSGGGPAADPHDKPNPGRTPPLRAA